jgi:hypothetical protein
MVLTLCLALIFLVDFSERLARGLNDRIGSREEVPRTGDPRQQ